MAPRSAPTALIGIQDINIRSQMGGLDGGIMTYEF